MVQRFDQNLGPSNGTLVNGRHREERSLRWRARAQSTLLLPNLMGSVHEGKLDVLSNAKSFATKVNESRIFRMVPDNSDFGSESTTVTVFKIFEQWIQFVNCDVCVRKYILLLSRNMCTFLLT